MSLVENITIMVNFESCGQPELWSRHSTWHGLEHEAEHIVFQYYHDAGSGKTPRYYQVNATNAAIEAMAKLSSHPGTIGRDVEFYRP